MSGNDIWSIFQAAQRACDDGESTKDFEPAFTEVLLFIKRNPACRVDAVTLITRGLQGSNGIPWELLAFLMHELRWPEIKAEANRLIERSEDWRAKTPLSNVVAAFEEDWPDADLYVRWQQPRSE